VRHRHEAPLLEEGDGRRARTLDDLLTGDELAHLANEPAREAVTAPIPRSSTRSCANCSLRHLYAHQRETWDAARRGEHVMVTTGTASGKTLAFNLPVLDAVARDPKAAHALLYPTKALAQDQARTLSAFRLPRTTRGDLRRRHADGAAVADPQVANLILYEPGHAPVGMLPHHDRWGDVLSNLRYVVIDEAHVYRGVFGSHVGNVLRRLRRMAKGLRRRAAVPARLRDDREPGGLAHSLLGLDVTVVGTDAAPRAERTIGLLEPAARRRGSSAPAPRRSAKASRLYAELVSRACGRSASRRAGAAPS